MGERCTFCHSDGSDSGAEESTTLEYEPAQDKTSNLGRSLDSHSLARDDNRGRSPTISLSARDDRRVYRRPTHPYPPRDDLQGGERG